MVNSVMPKIVGDELEWSNDAKFCLTRDILWTRDHWTKGFDTVFSLTANQTQQLFRDFVRPLNSSLHGQKPQYQVWRVAKKDTAGETNDDMLVGDVTCANGATWLMHFAQTHFGVSPPPGLRLPGHLRADARLSRGARQHHGRRGVGQGRQVLQAHVGFEGEGLKS
eukprot:SRR837773.19633.p1 GENE.SRR837773.19633~~SRR837773.19633.p1  ORF type:complete len:166 (-),score=39.47 SRR837773.19633:39-536(-)